MACYKLIKTIEAKRLTTIVHEGGDTIFIAMIVVMMMATAVWIITFMLVAMVMLVTVALLVMPVMMVFMVVMVVVEDTL